MPKEHLIGMFILAFFALILLLGQILDWKFIAKPSKNFGYIYPLNMLGRWFGKKFLKFFNYIFGSILLVLSVLMIITILTE